MNQQRRVLFSIVFGLLAMMCVASNVSLAEEASAARPHIVFLVADDLGYADLGFMGSREIHTPHLDKLAHGGAILESFYVQPVCSPTRATLMTGRYPTRTGVYTIVRPNAPWGLPLEERTLAVALREAGYHTALCGKWHLGEFQPEYRPTRRGFQQQYGHFFGQIDYFTKLRDGQRDWYRNDERCGDEGYSTHLIAREACRVIRERPQDRPLFLYVPFNAVHGPYQVPDQYLSRYAPLKGTRQKYAGMVTAMDEAVGQIVAALEESDIRQETLIVFSSDNGGPSPGQITNNGPLRAGKGTIYEGGVRVCAFANAPARIKPGTRIKEPIHMIDWFPTLVKLARGSLAQKLPLDGLDVWPVITQGAKSPHEAILLCAQPTKAAVRMGDWKLLLNATSPDSEAAEPTDSPKATKQKAKQKTKAKAKSVAESVQLFHLAEDLGEQHDLATQHPERVATLRAKLNQLLTDAVKPGNLP